MKNILRTIAAVICIAVITVCAILIIGKTVGRARLDVTENDLYTLSDGTQNILGKLSQPITLKLYYSRVAAMKGPEQIRFWNNYYLYVRDLLEEYVSVAGGRLKLEVIDPRTYSDEEEEAIERGIKRFPLSKDEGFFFGLVAETELGKEKVIEFFEPARQELVEYDVSKIISGLMQRDKRKIGVISSLPVLGTDMSPYMMQMLQMQGKTPDRPWSLAQHLKTEYEVQKVTAERGALPKDIDFLMLVHPKELDEQTLFAIDQYVMNGGKLLVFVDPHCMSDVPPRDPRNPYAAMGYKASSELNSLLKKWGVGTKTSEIAVDRSLAIEAQMTRDGAPKALLPYIQLTPECVNPDEVVSAKLQSIRMLFPGVLRKVDGAKTTVRPLLTTTDTGGVWRPKGPFELQMPNPDVIAKSVKDSREKVNLACLITGKLETNFPDGIEIDIEVDKAEGTEGDKSGKKETEEEKKTEKTRLKAVKEAAAGAAVFVVADVDFITDQLSYQQQFFGVSQVGDGPSLVLNTIEFFAGSGDLISIRSRGRFSHPFKVVDEIEREAEEATAVEVEILNAKIKNYRDQLTKLGDSDDQKDLTLIRNAALDQRAKIETDIRQANKDLRRLQEKRREKVEALAASLQAWNMVAAPAVIFLIAIALAAVRHIRAKRYVVRRT